MGAEAWKRENPCPCNGCNHQELHNCTCAAYRFWLAGVAGQVFLETAQASAQRIRANRNN